MHRALAAGAAPPDAPPALRDLLAAVTPDPAWLDRDLAERGARAYRRLGRSRDDVLLGLSLIGGYRFGGPTELLVRTGGLSGPGAMRRLAETQAWAFAVSRPGGMRPGADGWRATLHVRAMHALVANRFEDRHDVATHGLPINQADAAATLGLFNSTALLGCRLLGRPVTRAESRAVMHLWRYVGWLLGVDEDWLFDDERAQNRFNHHVLLAQGDVTPNGAALAGALVEGLRSERTGGRLDRLRGAWERRRLLSLLRVFLRAEGLRDLGLPVTLPWAVPAQVVRNLVEAVLVSRTRRGRRLLERWSDRRVQADLARRFGPDRPGPRALAI
ncbi:oxygenase MpaB family protein [Pseudonocardia sp. HH130630-07]|uniref:oxygenase MpaB family protein n=1 Tax=Pseudonocardia sp. HH130630-07 TaxID=1690815 RepID=UPI000B045453|nr:oxygenase MpaB family protein [Pseudonocardia sp. HH130630-07]